MKIWLYSLISVLIVSLVSLIGIITIPLKPERLKKILHFLVSFAVGGLFGDTFIHILPQVFSTLGTNVGTSLCIISGIFIFFVLEKIIRWRHCHSITSNTHTHPVVVMNLIGDSVHNLIDGALIGASFCVSIPIGIATTWAVIFHEIPQEIGDFGILVHGGLSVKKALLCNVLTALTSVLGVVISLLMGQYVKDYATVVLAFTAGGFIYIAGSDLIPELHQTCNVKISHSLWQLVAMLLGVGVMAALIFLE